MRCLLVSLSLVGMLAGGTPFAPTTAVAQDVSVGAEVAELRDQLLNGLRAGRPQDRAFINYVVGLVDEGVLSRELVVTTFLWARKKYKYQAPYFERGIRYRAAQLGIHVKASEDL